MDLVHFLFEVFRSYTPPIAFFAGFLSEDVLLFLSILSGSEHLPLIIVFVFGFLGAITHDSILIFLGRTKAAHSIKKRVDLSKRDYGMMEKIADKIRNNSLFLTLFISKFIYGVRTIVLLYSSNKDKKFIHFFSLNALAVLLYCLIMVPLGYLAGKGFSQFLGYMKGLERFLLVFVVTLLIFYILKDHIISFIYKRRDKIPKIK